MASQQPDGTFNDCVCVCVLQVNMWLGSGEGAMLQLLPQATQQAVTAAWLATLHQRQPSKVYLSSFLPAASISRPRAQDLVLSR